jgi:hypothetical protein
MRCPLSHGDVISGTKAARLITPESPPMRKFRLGGTRARGLGRQMSRKISTEILRHPHLLSICISYRSAFVTGHDFTGCGKTHSGRLELSGNHFTGCGKLIPSGKKRQGTTFVVSPWAFDAPKCMKTPLRHPPRRGNTTVAQGDSPG